MKEWGLIADSSCDLNHQLFDSCDAYFATVPLKIVVGDREFVDLPETDPREMLRAVHEFKGPSSTACPSPADFAVQLRQAKNSFIVTISSRLSGTYNAALQAIELIRDELPGHKVHVVDSLSTAGTMVLILRRLRDLIAQGLPFEEIVEAIERYRDQMVILFSLATFDALVKNGRMSAVTGILATALNIRAVARNNDGRIQVLEKPRGERRAIERMVDLMGKAKEMGSRTPVVITHCGNRSGADSLRQLIEKNYGSEDITILDCACLTSFYAGEQGLLLSF